MQTWGESTRKGSLLYLHVFTWPTNGQLIVGGLKSETRNAAPLVARSFEPPVVGPAPEIFQVSRVNPLDVCVHVSGTAPNPIDSVIKLDCIGEIEADTNRLLQPVFPVETLRAFDGELQGKGQKFGPGKKTDDVVMNWTRKDQSIVWPVRVTQASKYDVVINYDAPADSGGGTFRVLFELPPRERTAMAPEILTGTVKAGNSHGEALGMVSIGSYTAYIQIVPVDIHGDELMRLRSLQIKPVTAN